jgi:hypothetical protein
MTTYVKMMGDENLPDEDVYKAYTLFTLADGDSIEFINANGTKGQLDYFCISRQNGKTEKLYLTGNVYIMNAAGKTIATHGSRNPSRRPRQAEIPDDE